MSSSTGPLQLHVLLRIGCQSFLDLNLNDIVFAYLKYSSHLPASYEFKMTSDKILAFRNDDHQPSDACSTVGRICGD